MRASGWGRIINTASAHSLVASPQQERLCRRQAWRRRLHQGGRAGSRAATASPSIASRPAMSGRPLVENQIPDTMKARGLTREQVINDVLLAAQPTKRFVTAEEVAALALFLCRDEAGVDHRRQPSAWTAAGPRPRLAAMRSPARRSLPCLAARRLRPADRQPRDDPADRPATGARSRPTPTASGCATGATLRRGAGARRAAAGHGADIAAEGALLDPDAALPARPSPTATIAAG